MTRPTVIQTITGVLYALAAVLVALGLIDRFGSHPHRDLAPASIDQLSPQQQLSLENGGWRRGPAEATVTIVVFENLFCGHCAEFDTTLQVLLRRNPQHLAVVNRYYVPRDATVQLSAHLAMECAALTPYAEAYHSAFLSTGQHLTSAKPWLDVASLVGMPNLDQLKSCVRSGRFMRGIAQDRELGDSLGVTGTPTSFINGRRVVGAVPTLALEGLIATALGRSPKKVQ